MSFTGETRTRVWDPDFKRRLAAAAENRLSDPDTFLSILREVPTYWTMKELGRACSMDDATARKWLKRANNTRLDNQ